MFNIDQEAQRLNRWKRSLNTWLPDVWAEVQLTDEVRMVREQSFGQYSPAISLLWNNGQREVKTYLDIEKFEMGFIVLDMPGQSFSATAVMRCTTALKNAFDDTPHSSNPQVLVWEVQSCDRNE